MPSLIPESEVDHNILGGHPDARPRIAQPLKYSGSLDQYKSNQLTPVIGTEFEDIQVTDLLAADDQVIRDLAVTSGYPTRRRKAAPK
jgi:hypothetical protein